MPVVPGKKETGTKTAISTSDVAITALVTSTSPRRWPCADRNAQRNVTLNILDDYDGVVNHQAGGKGDAEERERVDGEAEYLDEREGADERDWDGDRGNDGCAPVEQEEEDHHDDDHDGFAEGDQNLMNRVADDRW
jgi:hypothetical protein